jgi:hypothetical protein
MRALESPGLQHPAHHQRYDYSGANDQKNRDRNANHRIPIGAGLKLFGFLK